MSNATDRIVSEALALSPQARAFVAECLIESLDSAPGPDLSPKWRAEVRRRIREIDKGEVKLQDSSEVFAKSYAALE